uniref:Uncharacterized protein n=1 Tax=Photinus pyralis TaxID=7054 RepID=A0A1Y1LFZ1_PHOPY
MCPKTELLVIPSKRLAFRLVSRYKEASDKKRKINTAIGTKNQGVADEITIIVPINVKIICIACMVMLGNVSSIVPISFEKRFKILPDEFRLKNLIVPLRILLNIL